MTLWAVCAREDAPHFRILCLATSCHEAKNNKLNFLVTTGETGDMSFGVLEYSGIVPFNVTVYCKQW